MDTLDVDSRGDSSYIYCNFGADLGLEMLEMSVFTFEAKTNNDEKLFLITAGLHKGSKVMISVS